MNHAFADSAPTTSRVFSARCTWTVWTLMRKRSQLRSVTSTVKYLAPRCGLLYRCTESCRAHINSNDCYLRAAGRQLPESQSVEVSGRVRGRPSSRQRHGAHRVAAADLCGPAPPDRTSHRSDVVFAIKRASSIPPIPLAGCPRVTVHRRNSSVRLPSRSVDATIGSV